MKSGWARLVLIFGLSMALSAFAGCGGDDGSSPVDNQPPGVAATNPAAGATGVSPNRPVRISFSEAMDETSLDSIFIEGVKVSAREYEDETHSVTLWFSEMLEAGTEYRVRVASSVRDRAGNPMTGDHTFSYTTVPGPLTCNSLYDLYESDDHIESSTKIDLGKWYWLVPSCGGLERYDFYEFTLIDAARVTLRMNFVFADTADMGWRINFYRRDGGSYSSFRESLTLPAEMMLSHSFLPGTYYARICKADDDEHVGVYSFTVETSNPCHDDEYEDNDFEDEAVPITAGLLEGLRGCDEDADYYSIEIEEGETLRVTMTEVTSVAGGVDRKLSLFGPGVGTGPTNRTEPRIEMITALETGTHYIEAMWWADGVVYDLNVEVFD
jgi:hypothetical protein